MARTITVGMILLSACIVMAALFWPMYYFYTRDGYWGTNALANWIVSKGNDLRTRNAMGLPPGKLYPDMSDQEFGSRIVHSICANGAPCLEKQRYRLDVWSRTPDYKSAGAAFGVDLGARWKRKVEPGDRYVCHMTNPYWFSCISGSFRSTEYRFIPDGPYTPIEMWDEDGAARDR